MSSHMVPFQTKFHDFHNFNRSKGPCDVLIPGNGGAGGVWKSGDLGIWKSGNLEIWGPGNPHIWRSGDLEIQEFEVQKNEKIINNILKSKSALPKMSARSESVGTKIFLVLFGAIPSQFFHRPETSKKNQKFVYFPWWANGPYSPGAGPCCYPPEVGQ